MSIYQAVILGIVQGITEFIPVSSSGHLVIIQSLFDMKKPMLAFDVFLHAGTLVSILIFFRKDILGLVKLKNRRMLLFLTVGTLPAAFFGILFKEKIEAAFSNPLLAGCMFLITGVWLCLASLYLKRLKTGRAAAKPGFLNSIVVGLAQAASILPGISRSGSTIATGILAGLEKEAAFRFAMLLSVPAVGGAILLKARAISLSGMGAESVPFLLGGLTAMVVGIVAINFLLRAVRRNQLYIFGIYCLLLGSAAIIYFR